MKSDRRSQVSLTPFRHPSLALLGLHPSVHRIPENFNAIGRTPGATDWKSVVPPWRPLGGRGAWDLRRGVVVGILLPHGRGSVGVFAAALGGGFRCDVWGWCMKLLVLLHRLSSVPFVPCVP